VGASESGTAGPGGVSEEQDDGDFFVMKPSEEHGEVALASLLGVWRVFQSQGYPYYLHEDSGHSQWEDPRDRKTVRPREPSTTAAADIAADVGYGSDRRSEAKGR
ncbi:unnamed protein product, partial [Pylaiella littoralis]